MCKHASLAFHELACFPCFPLECVVSDNHTHSPPQGGLLEIPTGKGIKNQYV